MTLHDAKQLREGQEVKTLLYATGARPVPVFGFVMHADSRGVVLRWNLPCGIATQLVRLDRITTPDGLHYIERVAA